MAPGHRPREAISIAPALALRYLGGCELQTDCEKYRTDKAYRGKRNGKLRGSRGLLLEPGKTLTAVGGDDDVALGRGTRHREAARAGGGRSEATTPQIERYRRKTQIMAEAATYSRYCPSYLTN